jgi:hypothetical protein
VDFRKEMIVCCSEKYQGETEGAILHIAISNPGLKITKGNCGLQERLNKKSYCYFFRIAYLLELQATQLFRRGQWSELRVTDEINGLTILRIIWTQV